MSETLQETARKIASKEFKKGEAVEYFDSLSGSDKNALLQLLKSSLDLHEKLSTEDDKKRSLKAVEERELTDQHKEFIENLKDMMREFAPKSKGNAERHQTYFVDQRKIANLKKILKPMQFHLTYEKGEGAYLYDIDGNKYVDITGDNGVNLFGHQAKFINDSVQRRLDKGFPLVGFTDELFEAAKLFSDITGHERVLFTQSGTEAVMWAVRIARAATQRKKIVIFEGSYHGLSDAVLAMKDFDGNSVSLGLGMLQEFADQLIVLDYGETSQLETIKARAGEIAGVLVEPIQSRHPDLQPKEFLQELRKVTIEHDIPLIFDEMITGFRTCPRGAQGFFGVTADIATYGKVPGGGMPTGMIAGMAKYMDYVDGGSWQLDDDSMPSLKRTLMAGTHTRNPLKIAATVATLREIKANSSFKESCENCDCFQKEITNKTYTLVSELNSFFQENRLPVMIESFSSLFRFKFLDTGSGLVSELFFVLLRLNGVETSVSGNFFLNKAHTDEDVTKIIESVKESFIHLMENQFFSERPEEEPSDADTNFSFMQSSAEDKYVDDKPKSVGTDNDHIKARLKSDLLRIQEEA